MVIFRINKVNIFFICLLIVAILLSCTSKVQAEQDGNYIYTVTDGTAIIIEYTGTEQDIVVPSTLGGLPVTSIGDFAFYNDNTTTITIPQGVTSISDWALSSLTGLTAIIVADDNLIYKSMDGILYNKAGTVLIACPRGLTSIIIPQGVKSIGDAAFALSTSLTSISIPDGVTSIGTDAFFGCHILTSVTMPEGVTSIGDNAFYCCYALTSISIPESVTYIGENAFFNCRSLTNINIPQAITSISRAAFASCTSLTSITIPQGVTSIGSYAFAYCYSLTSINIPSGVTSINDGTFEYCTGLTSIVIPEGVTNIGYAAFNGCTGISSISIPSAVTSIDALAFYGCTGLSNIVIPQGVTSVGDWAFWGCTNLDSITFNSATTSIYDSSSTINRKTKIIGHDPSTAKDYATKYGRVFEVVSITNTLQSIAITIPATKLVYTVGDTLDLTGLVVTGTYSDGSAQVENITAANVTGFDSSVAATNQVLTINVSGKTTTYTVQIFSSVNDYYIFEETPTGEARITKYIGNEKDVVIPSTLGGLPVTSIWGVYNSEDEVWDGAFLNCHYITNVSIPEGVTSIGEGAFSGCDGLTSISLPQSLNSIGNWAFAACASLTSITIPEGVTSIGDFAFNSCSSLTSLSIPQSINSIGEGCFYFCTGLNNITIPQGIASISNYAFSHCTNLTSIIIPEGVTSIGDNAFEGCISLNSINIPQGVTSIGDNAFYFCTSLTSIIIPEGVTSIGDNVFYRCANLTSISIPEGVTRIGNWAFFECTSLTNINIPQGVRGICDHAFAGCIGFNSINLPQSLEIIGQESFYGCTSLSSITFNSVTTVIPDDEYTIPATTKIIGFDPSTAKDYAAKYGRAFEVIVITNTLQSIAITTPATKQIYTVGDAIDIAGLEVTGTYSDGSTQVETITADNISGFDSSSPAASQTITITVNDKTASYNIRIVAAEVTLSSIAITSPANKQVYAIGNQLDLTGLEVTGTYSDGSTRVEEITTANVSGFDSSSLSTEQVLTITVGDKTTTYTVSITKVEVNNTPLQITVPSDVTDAVLMTNPENGVVIIPEVSVQSSTSFGIVEMSIPDGTQITGPQDWDGTICLPRVVEKDSITVTLDSGDEAIVSAAIEIGLPDTVLTFSQPVRILLTGQGGKNAGWVRNYIFNPISYQMEYDSAEALGINPDGYITVGNDLVIWTTHFTTFIAYTIADKVDPVIEQITATSVPVQLGQQVDATATFTGPGSLNTYNASWSWGDGSTSIGTITEANGFGTVSGSYNYSTPGVYTIMVSITDIGSLKCQEYVVVYDPDGGFVTGGGWINSPAGSYADNPTLTGRASFGFVSKYKKGNTVPTGQTEFQFKVANLNFKSTSYDWLVIAGAKVQYKGIGTINGQGNYDFMITAVDGQIKGSRGDDKFRIKIWDNASGKIVYDNQMDAKDGAEPTTKLDGGSIVIHEGK